MVDLDDVKAFLAVAEAGSVSGAALAMATSKSVLSRRVSRLEDDLGARLFTRSSKGITPTEAGEALLARARHAFDELSEALNDAAQRSEELTGLLRVTAPIAFVSCLASIGSIVTRPSFRGKSSFGVPSSCAKPSTNTSRRGGSASTMSQ